MTKETLQTLIDLLNKEMEMYRKAYEAGIDLINFSETGHVIQVLLMKALWGEQSFDIFSWYVFENGRQWWPEGGDGPEKEYTFEDLCRELNVVSAEKN